ncbi:MAG: adenylyltransferase/cytidyltransferase family protein [Acidimicrobiales bacterium]
MRNGGRSVVTIGAYDGVHVGHRRVIDKVRSLAAESGLKSVILTFDRHPASLVRPESAPKLLTDLAQKLELLQATGVDDVVVLRFDEARASETAEDFVDDVLVSQLSAAAVVVGRDFHFGKARGGNVALLENMGADRDMTVVPFDLVSEGDGGEVVSSTRIRHLLEAGDLLEVTALLGRPHQVRGLAGAAGTIGSSYPVEVPAEILLPPAGSYRCQVAVAGAELAEAEVVLPVGGGLVVTGAPPGPGAAVRVLFEAETKT